MSDLKYTNFQYHPLTQSETLLPVRLLNLHVDPENSQLSCNIQHTELKQYFKTPPVFDALSYVWGPSEANTSNILVSNQRGQFTLPILPSLQQALCRLRQGETHDRLLWVDALCINQSDDIEKSQQVPMMGKIYQNARSVIIWLGEEADDSDLAMDFILQVTDLAKLDQIIKDQNSTRQWYALSKLMNRPWLSRRWVVQELAFAKDARLCCGDREVDWALFADAATLFGKMQQDIVKLFWMSPEYAHDAEIFGEIEALGALRLIDASNRLFRHSESWHISEGLVSLETLVTSLECFKTKDPRDSIYAVMHLAEEADDIASGAKHDVHQQAKTLYPRLAVNYSLPFDEIARGFVASCIRRSGSLDVICRPWAPVPTYYYYPSQDQQKLSSWACTLDDSVFEIREDGHQVRRKGNSFVGMPGRPIYQASKGFPFIPFEAPSIPKDDHRSFLEIARFPFDAVWSFKASRMEVKGLKIGTISFIGERAMEGNIPAGWFSMAQWSHRRPPASEHFYRTLVADRGTNGSNPPSWYKRAFEYALGNSGMGDVRIRRMMKQTKSTVTAELLTRIQSFIWNRRFALTDRDAFGLVPANAQVGDSVVILYGASVPVILRRLQSSYRLVGECYIHGAMDGFKSSSNGDVTGPFPLNPAGSSSPSKNMAEIISIR